MLHGCTPVGVFSKAWKNDTLASRLPKTCVCVYIYIYTTLSRGPCHGSINLEYDRFVYKRAKGFKEVDRGLARGDLPIIIKDTTVGGRAGILLCH